MDSKRLPLSASTVLLRRCFHGLFDDPHAVAHSFDTSIIRRLYEQNFGGRLESPPSIQKYPDQEIFRFENCAIEMASRLASALSALLYRYRRRGLEQAFLARLNEFYIRTLKLIAGQLSSLDQAIVDEAHDWGWYREVLNGKSIDVLLALLSLFVDGVPEESRSEKLKACFHLINGTFFHRQVLDDLLDVEEDVLSGTANSLTYMIISQGRIASLCVGGNISACNREILAEIARSQLLANEFTARSDQKLVDQLRTREIEELDFGPNEVEILIRHALSNRDTDWQSSLKELAEISLKRQTSLVEAWSQARWRTALAIIRESGIAARILDSIGRRSQTEVERALAMLNDNDVKEVMSLFYVRTFRTYKKCVVACQPYL